MRNPALIPMPGKNGDRPRDPAGQAPPVVGPPKIASPVSTIANGNMLGPRKLVRPKLPPRPLGSRYAGPRAEQPALAHHAALSTASAINQESSHAEAFYFQKQVQSQTRMVFVLEDGEQIEGIIEWYDRGVIKVKNAGRVLIYKSSIKYLYKAGESHP